MTRHSDPSMFSEAEVTLVDNQAGYQWDLDDDHEPHRPTEPCLAPPTLTADSLRQRRTWKRSATDARRSLAERRDEREALSRVLALAKPRSPAPAPFAPMRLATQNG